MVVFLVLNLFSGLSSLSLSRRKTVNLDERLHADGEALAERLREYIARTKRRFLVEQIRHLIEEAHSEIGYCDGQIEFLLRKEEEARQKAMSVVTGGLAAGSAGSGAGVGPQSRESYLSQRYAWTEFDEVADEAKLEELDLELDLGGEETSSPYLFDQAQGEGENQEKETEATATKAVSSPVHVTELPETHLLDEGAAEVLEEGEQDLELGLELEVAAFEPEAVQLRVPGPEQAFSVAQPHFEAEVEAKEEGKVEQDELDQLLLELQPATSPKVEASHSQIHACAEAEQEVEEEEDELDRLLAELQRSKPVSFVTIPSVFTPTSKAPLDELDRLMLELGIEE